MCVCVCCLCFFGGGGGDGGCGGWYRSKLLLVRMTFTVPQGPIATLNRWCIRRGFKKITVFRNGSVAQTMFVGEGFRSSGQCRSQFVMDPSARTKGRSGFLRACWFGFFASGRPCIGVIRELRAVAFRGCRGAHLAPGQPNSR